MVSEIVSAHLEKAAKRAARIAQADASGLEQGQDVKHPGKRTSEKLEKAKEASRPEANNIL